MDEATYEMLANEVLKAEDTREPLKLFTERFPDITIKDSYQIHLRVVEKKIARGEKVIGKKIGLTSKAMQELLGIDEPDYGFIMSTNIAGEGTISMSELIEPKAEPEVAFVFMDDLEGPGVTAAHVLAATAGVLPSIEIIDSRFAGWGIKIQDSIADGASIGRVVFGAGGLTDVSTPNPLDLRYIGLVLEKNGEIVETAAGAAVLGNPAESVAWLANKLSEYGIILKAGEVVISGSLTKAVPVQTGDYVRAIFGQLGSVGIKFIE
ncbi:MAG: 2-keto-4-pentenoate hydratase [Promethearchaeota archaeon]